MSKYIAVRSIDPILCSCSVAGVVLIKDKSFFDKTWEIV